jgi:hypothetical protein
MLAEFGEDLVDRIRNADAALNGDRAAPQCTDFGTQGFRLVGAVVVVDRDVATLAGELQRDGAPDAARGAGDERDFSGLHTRHHGIPAAFCGHWQNCYFNLSAKARLARTRRCASIVQCFLTLYQTSAAHNAPLPASAGGVATPASAAR